MGRIFLVIFLFLTAPVFAQVTASTRSFDFGDLYNGSTTYTDITFKNTTGKTQFLLTIDKPADVYYIFSGKRIDPDSTITIRFKINENRKGRFNYNVDVYFSQPREPIPIKLQGTVKELNRQNSLTACPDFNSAPPAHMNQFDMVVRVIDSITRKPIPNANVYVVENGELVVNGRTNNKGVVKKRLMLGYFFITAERTPYKSNFYEGYMNYKRNYVEIELSQPPAEIEPIIEEPVVEEPVIEEPVINEPVVNEPVIEEPVIEIVIEEPVVEEPVVNEPVLNDPPVVNDPVEPVELTELPDTVFTPDYFKFNNITFILDVSSSMNGMGKMDLLKMSMIELAKTLRANDKVSMIKFSAEVEVLLEGISGAEEEQIVSTVKGLKTSSYTAGGDAIKMAYKLNRKHYIEGGNNMVIMITDGVFNRGDKDYLKTIKRYYNSQGVIFSVVGIKTSDYITDHMMNVVSNGGGDFVRILNIHDAQTKLIEEIRRTSFKF